MKLKLRTSNIETLKTTLSLISQLRKYIILQFDPSNLLVISVNNLSTTQEPQVWCRLQINSIFDQIEIHSLRNNTISIEINVELLLQTLKNFDKANSDGLNLRLQRKESSGTQGANLGKSRTASIALYYSHVNLNQNTINHTFRIPVKILKNDHDYLMLKEPSLKDVNLMMRLPKEFSSIYKRFDKFKKISQNDIVTIKASRRNNGFLGFVLEEDGKFKVTISWNDKLEMQKPNFDNVESDSIRQAVFDRRVNEEIRDEDDNNEDKEIFVRLKDWQMSSKIVSTCKTVLFMLTDTDCVMHCLLNDSEDVQIIYYISGIVIRNPLDY